MSNSEKKDNLSNSKATPTTFQMFFWKIAGSEISILERCPTDWNKQVGIGLAIFMTTLLAFFSGAYAAYFFSESLLASSAFGLLWAALIYSIDRSLVVTLKKTPDKKWYEYLLPFALRGLLSLIIAFVISIPLELLIFEENIEIHMTKYKQNQVAIVSKLENNNQNIYGQKSQLKSDSLTLKDYQNELSFGEPQNDNNYNLLKNSLNKNLPIYNTKQTKTKNNKNKYVSIKNNLNSSPIQINQAKINYDNSNTDENRFYNQKIKPLKDSINNYVLKWKNNLNSNIINQRTSIRNSNNNLRLSNNKISKTSSFQDSLLQNKKGFVLKFRVLENLASGKETKENPDGYTIWVLLWLIRFLFILIELLPTIVKTVTPLGSYDLALWAEEQNFAKSLSSGEVEYLEHQTRLRQLEQETLLQQAKDRNIIQEELNKNLLKEIAAAQDAVARQKIAEYKEKHLKK